MFYEAHFTIDVTNWSQGIGQIAVGASGGSVEFAPSCLRSPDRSYAVEEAWRGFCGRIREIPDSRVV